MDADGIVKRYMWWSMGAGLLPFPVLDLAAVTGVQLKMLDRLSGLYEIEFSENRGRNIIGALLGGLIPQSLAVGTAGSLFKSLPIIGPALGGVTMSLFSGASTYAVGKIFNNHFASGGTLLDFDADSDAVREAFADAFEEGQEEAKKSTGAKKKA